MARSLQTSAFWSCAALGMAFAPASAGAADWKTRFSQEAQAKWAEYQRFAERLQGGGTGKRYYNGKLNLHSRWQVKHNRHCWLLLNQDLLEDSHQSSWEEAAIGYNPVYDFELIRKPGGERLEIAKLTKRVEGKPPPYETRTNILVSVGNDELSALAKLPTFQVVDAVAAELDGELVVKLQFDNTHRPNPKLRECNIQRGILYLDPKRFWCVKRFNLTRNHGSAHDRTSEGEVVIVDLAAGYPLPRRFKMVTQTPEPGKEETMVFEEEYDLSVPASLPGDEEFTLSAFGLPEPAGLPPVVRHSYWHWWTAGAGLLCLVGGVYWYRRRQRAVMVSARAP